MKNRYGDEWSWEDLGNNKYKFHMSGNSLEFGRYGGKVGQKGIDIEDLGMFDPSGGPYISCRDEYAGSKILGKEIIHLGCFDGHYIATVEDIKHDVEL